MDVLRLEQLWGDISQQKIKPHALEYLVDKLASNKNESVIMRLLWGLDVLVEKMVFSPREITHALVCSESLRVESVPFFRCAFKLLLKLIFFSDYKSNREVFNKSIEKSSQFSTASLGNRSYLRFIDPAIEVIRLLLCREMCLMPAYFAMHELIRSFPNESTVSPHQSILNDISQFMESFARPARLLYSQVHHYVKPVCGVTFSTSPGFRLDSSTLVLTSVKGAMRYPDFLTSPQTQLLCSVLGQLRSTELTTGMLDPSTGKSKVRSIGLELALVDWIVELMEITESVRDDRWVRIMFEHLISIVITFMLSTTIRFNEIVIKLNSKLEGRTWTNSCHYVMWFVLNATSGFIGKNMRSIHVISHFCAQRYTFQLTDFVPCLRLFDILFPDAEDPDRALEIQLPGYRKRLDRRLADGTSERDPLNGRSEDGFNRASDMDSTPKSSHKYDVSDRLGGQEKTMSLDGVVDDLTGEETSDQEGDQGESIDSTSAEESSEESSLDILPPSSYRSMHIRKRQSRLMHLTSAPVCLWQHVLRKSHQSHDHLPRVMPPALRPMETRIFHRMRLLIDSVLNMDNINNPIPSSASQLTWKQLFVILNAYSTDTEVSQLIQRLVDMLWFAETDVSTSPSPYARLWPKLLNNGLVTLPYGLVARGRLQPLPHHLIRTMSVHLRMLVLHLLLQKFVQLQHSDQLTTPAVAETMCRILACREVEPNNVNRILTLLPKLQPVWPTGESENSLAQSSAESNQTGNSLAYSGSALTTCNLLATLLDVIGHRLADTLLPEVRLQTLITLVNLFRLWSSSASANANAMSNEEVRLARDGKFPGSSFEVPLELFYNLEWIICKLSRSIQVPDCVIYGLCLAISPAMLAQASQSASLMTGAAVGTGTAMGSGTTGPQTLQCGARNVTGTASRSGAPSGTHQSCASSMTADAIATNVGMSDMPGNMGATMPGGVTVPGYPFLMTDNLELNRFVLFSLLQVYYVYDLDEICGMKAFLAEQIRATYERCGPSSLLELPRLISSRLPDFFNQIIRQLVSSSSGQFSAPVPNPIEMNTGEKQLHLRQLLSAVWEEYKRLSDGTTTWLQLVGRGSLILCVVLRFLAAQNSVPKMALSILSKLHMNTMSVSLRTLCDYMIACLSESSNATDELMSEKSLDALSAFCVSWRIVPLDRLLLFLLTHTNYCGSQLDAVNRIIVHLFTRSEQLTLAVQYLDENFVVSISTISRAIKQSSSQATESNLADQSLSKDVFHPDPVSSRHWTTTLLHLHELIPDQWITWNPSTTGGRPSKPDQANTGPNPNPNFPVLYGHLVLRLLPMLEAVLAHFIETELPLVRLIPFCQAVTPLFRFHRRPVNTSFVLLREHWHFVPPDADGTNADNQLAWFVGRLRVQLVTHCVLSRTQTLAVHHARAHRLAGANTDVEVQSGLLTLRGWSELCASVEVAKNAYIRIRSKYPEDARFCAEAESELEAVLYDWYNAHVTCADSEFVAALLNPIVLSTQKCGLYGHPAAWRPWNLEENVSVQAAGLYAAAVEIMSSYTTPKEFVAAMTDFLLPRTVIPNNGDCLNVLGALTALLPSPYRMAICQFTTSLFLENVLTDPVGPRDWPNHSEECNPVSPWSRPSRIKRHARWLDPEENESLTDSCPSPPLVAVNFFKDFLPPQLNSTTITTSNTNWRDGRDNSKKGDVVESNVGCSGSGQDRSSSAPISSKEDVSKHTCLLKASLWHAIWSHANTTHLTALPTLFTELFVPHLSNEAQLLMAFYLVAPLMGSLHSERPAKLIELTAQLYRAVAQVDAILSLKGKDGSANTDHNVDADPKPKQTGVPLVHVDTIADLLYHIKYMYVGNGVLDQVQPLLPKLRPNLRKRLKFILPPTEMFGSQSGQSAGQTLSRPSQAFPGEVARAVYEGRVYCAAAKPPLCGEDF
ncbi:hypothetical protein FGIG_02996 [Fasciola gigantica]|uniref:Mediator of RNA polymerase II transcription subunit 23 n=1 Tax=Fasciola gigantica TaxID=46835 RepID=A0A504YCM0_FASGI|nr:hypothetical protein FGIG_02996 [Fasciola gigantica]